MASTAPKKITDARGLIELLGDAAGPENEDAVFQGLEFTVERSPFGDGGQLIIDNVGALGYGASLESQIEAIHRLSYIALAYLGGAACGPVRA